MMRYAGQKRRATTSKLYAMDKDYNKVLQEAKRLHRPDGEFYIAKIFDDVEHWKFEGRRWKKQEDE